MQTAFVPERRIRSGPLMLAQRFIAMCDHDGCEAKTRATVLLKTVQVSPGVMSPIVLQPTKIVFREDGWSFGWVREKKTTEVYCPKHRKKESNGGKD